MKDSIHIVYILNDKYWIPVLVSAYSALLCRVCGGDREVKLIFHLLMDGVSLQHRERMLSKLSTPFSVVEIVDIDTITFLDMPEWHGSKLIWTRLAINRLLPTLNNWVCLCDGDTIWLKDPSLLCGILKQVDSNYLLCGSREVISNLSSEWFLRRKLSVPDSNYLCMGFTLVNLGGLRDNNFERQALAFVNDTGVPPFCEQDIFNYIFSDQKCLLPCGWGVSPILGLKQAHGDAAVVHYYGSTPWPATVKRRMLDIHVPWWHILIRILRIHEGGGYEMCMIRWTTMRLLTRVIQILPVAIAKKIHGTVRQVPYDYERIIDMYNRSYELLINAAKC